jgi:hypothetical protein
VSRFGGVPVGGQQKPTSGSRFGGVPAEVAPPVQPAPAQERGVVDSIMQGPVGQAGLGVLEGVSSLPGLPLDAIIEGGNFVRRQFDLPEFVPNDTVSSYRGQGWYDAAQRYLGVPTGPAPKNEVERIARKGGVFAGGALPFGPAGMVPSLTATAGSEVGRATDKAGLTGGYGEAAGALVGGAAPGVVRGVLTSGTKTGAPTKQNLRDMSRQKYLEAEQAGVIFNQAGINRLAQGVRADLTKLSFRPSQQPAVKTALDELDADLAGGNVTLEGLESLRGVATNAIRGTTNPVEKTMLGKFIERIDDLVDSPQAGELLAGDAKTASAALKEARAYWKQMRKSEIIDEALDTGELNAATAGSGGNVDNAIRQRIKAIIRNKKLRSQFTSEELFLMQRVARGSVSHNILRGLGALSPDKGMLPLVATAALSGGIVTGGVSPLAAAAIPAAMAARRGAEALTRRNVGRLSEAVRRGPAPQLTRAQKAQAAFEEAQRRARLIRQSGRAAIPGALNND